MPGKRLPDGPIRQRERGHLLARLHTTNRPLTSLGQRPGYDHLHEPSGIKDRVRWSDRLATLRLHQPALAEHIRAADAKLASALHRIAAQNLPETIVHGDFRAHNIHYHHTKVSGILDFDLTHLDLRIADLAIAGTPELIAGYHEAADPPLSTAETDAIQTLQRALHLHQVAFLFEQHCLDPAAYQHHLHRIR